MTSALSDSEQKTFLLFVSIWSLSESKATNQGEVAPRGEPLLGCVLYDQKCGRNEQTYRMYTVISPIYCSMPLFPGFCKDSVYIGFFYSRICMTLKSVYGEDGQNNITGCYICFHNSSSRLDSFVYRSWNISYISAISTRQDTGFKGSQIYSDLTHFSFSIRQSIVSPTLDILVLWAHWSFTTAVQKWICYRDGRASCGLGWGQGGKEGTLIK